MSNPTFDIPALLDDVLKRARSAGADTADAVAANSVSVSHAQRMGKMEKLERSESRDLGLRVFVGHRQAIVSSNDWTDEALDALAERAVAMAKTVPADEFAGIADPSEILQGTPPDVDGCDPVEPDPETLVERARQAEGAALAVDGVTNSEGAEADYSRWDIHLAASNGFSGCYAGSRHSVAVSVLAGEGVAMESDYDYASTVYAEDLEDSEKLGRTAAERAVAKLNPRKGATKPIPIVFDPRVSNGMLRHLAGAINGAAIAKGTSFLKDSMGKQIFPSGIRVVDDPHRPRGLASKPFDAEGLANGPMAFIEDGILQSWVLDLRTARKLGLTSTGHASRGTSGPPSPSTTNLTMEAGSISPKDLMADIKEGFYVTSMMGMGVNGITGDYSRGASGFWIENGEISFPVSEMTIAGNLKDMFLNLTPADDLTFKYSTNAPTIRIDGMTAAGM